ncbi:hypothetical protein G6F20_010457 [Rhizopus arrhizus]|nr:hypothetical protein G6F20_010457 [Rhizopus arrhizus]
MTFQETHVSDNTLSIINTQFQARYSLWTRHCGIVSFSPSFIFSDNLAPEHDRVILTKVKHPYNAFAPFWLLVLYAPATSGRQRQQFFDQVLHLLHNQDLDINFDRLFITGDFNYSYLRPQLSSQTSIQWVSFLEDHFYNALMNDDLHELPTFKRNDTTYSTIDYIFVNQAFRTQVIASNLHKLNASWTDHSLLSVTCCLGPSPSGPGLWRGNPLLARKPAYQHYLRQHLDHILLNIHSGWTAQKKWDFVKRQAKKNKKSLAIFQSIHQPVKMQDDKKASLIPTIFDSVYDFCKQFQNVLEAHYSKERPWFDERLRNKLLSWFEARNKTLDHFDIPYPGESTRVFASKFQNLRRESVHHVASVAVSSQYGSKLPVKTDAMIDLVITSTNNPDLFSSSVGSSSYISNKGNNERFSRYRCEAFLKVKKPKISRMARRSNATTETSTDENNNIEEDENSNDDDKNEHRLARLALQLNSGNP